MELFGNLIDTVLHLDVRLITLVEMYGLWIYLIVFIIIFCETGLVITPFLPGDSLLFTLGTLAATKALDLKTLIGILAVAAILGDTVNYWIGNILGKRVVHQKKIPFLRQEYLEKTERFFEKHGNKTIVLARFMPMFRTLAPFVAGIGKMKYSNFVFYNISGGLIWITVFLVGGYFFGNIPIVKENFEIVILGIIFVSCLPAVFEYIKARCRKR